MERSWSTRRIARAADSSISGVQETAGGPPVPLTNDPADDREPRHLSRWQSGCLSIEPRRRCRVCDASARRHAAPCCRRRASTALFSRRSDDCGTGRDRGSAPTAHVPGEPRCSSSPRTGQADAHRGGLCQRTQSGVVARRQESAVLRTTICRRFPVRAVRLVAGATRRKRAQAERSRDGVAGQGLEGGAAGDPNLGDMVGLPAVWTVSGVVFSALFGDSVNLWRLGVSENTGLAIADLARTTDERDG